MQSTATAVSSFIQKILKLLAHNSIQILFIPTLRQLIQNLGHFLKISIPNRLQHPAQALLKVSYIPVLLIAIWISIYLLKKLS